MDELTIKQVSEMTGVLSVTLRAWERRYGLIKPKRSEKGHRYYTQEDVERINAIVSWVDKGVAVSKIKPLLDNPTVSHEALETATEESIQLKVSLESFNVEKVKAIIAEGLKTNTFNGFYQQYWQPIAETFLQTARPDREAMLAVWNAAIVECCAGIIHQQSLPKKSPISWVLQMDATTESLAWLNALAESNQGRRVRFLTLPGENLTVLTPSINADDRLIMVGEQRLSKKAQGFLQDRIQQGNDCKLVGSIKQIHAELLA